ncbi:MAG: histidine ammonia-lyase [Candidatus Kapaibacteriales bacterium]
MELTGYNLTIDLLNKLTHGNENISLPKESWNKISACRSMLQEKIDSGQIMYGINTGIGEFSEVTLKPEETKEFQKFLIYNHAAGIGEKAPLHHIKAAMIGRVNVHAKGFSGNRPIITETLIKLINAEAIPVVCAKGSVGASGDLAPMSQMALCLMGEGEIEYKGQVRPAKEVMNELGIEIPGLEARDGLATINGSNLLTAISALQLYKIRDLLFLYEIAAAMSLVALKANLKPYDSRITELRGFAGAVKSSKTLTKLVEGSALEKGEIQVKVQDAYSMRSTPQVIGAAHDAFEYAKSQVEIELNGVGDNPIFLTDEKTYLSGANFQGTPVALPMDMMQTALTMASILSERRLNRMLNPALSSGLPPFLTEKPGLFSGMMLSQYTADTLIAEQRILSNPASIQSIPAAADQEDFVSMGMNTALKGEQILENAYGVVGIELMAAAQAIDIRKYNAGPMLTKAHELIREHVDYLDIDRPLYNDHNSMMKLASSGKIQRELRKML